MAVKKVTIVDSLDKMRPEKSLSREYSLLMGKKLNQASEDQSSGVKQDSSSDGKKD